MTDEGSGRRDGTSVERLLCHPRLPLVAGLDAGRPAVHLWDLTSGGPRRIDTVGADTAGYGETIGWERYVRTPSVSWHPYRPVLVMSGPSGPRRWTPAGVEALPGPPADAGYRTVSFSPDGRTVWASPAAGGDDWSRSDAIDVESGTVRTGPGWDTGIAAHPGGGLVVTFSSDQGATLALFARVDEGGPAVLRLLRKALILDVDGYETPLFSPDGRYFAIRGNAYDNTVRVFEFPSLRQVLATVLGEPSPGFPYPPQWMEQYRSWSRHNLAFAGGDPAVLLVGTPDGEVVALDVDTGQTVAYDVLGGERVTALAVAATGEIVVAGASGGLVQVRIPPAGIPSGRAAGTSAGGAGDGGRVISARERVAAFLSATSELPEDADLDEDLELTDGTRTWGSEDLATTTTATETDPTWLRILATTNAVRQRDADPVPPGATPRPDRG